MLQEVKLLRNGICLGLNSHVLTVDPNFLGHPSNWKVGVDFASTKSKKIEDLGNSVAINVHSQFLHDFARLN